MSGEVTLTITVGKEVNVFSSPESDEAAVLWIAQELEEQGAESRVKFLLNCSERGPIAVATAVPQPGAEVTFEDRARVMIETFLAHPTLTLVISVFFSPISKKSSNFI